MKVQRSEPIKRALVAGYPVIGISSVEEEFAVAVIEQLAASMFQNPAPITTWDLQNGLMQGNSSILSSSGPLEALDEIQNSEESGFFVFKDLFSFLDDPAVQRRIRNISIAFKGKGRYLLMTGAQTIVPVEIRKDIHILDFGYPKLDELIDLLRRNLGTAEKRGTEVVLDEKEISTVACAMKGFTLSEAQFCLNQILRTRKTVDSSILSVLQDEKEQIVKKEGIIEYVRSSERIEDVGGLENLKTWLIKRKKLFSPEAAQAGIRPPRGLLMMGISGCGKSLSVKAISSLWQLPLFRLDMNRIYSGMYGTPEGAFQRAIQSIEAVAPAILWIDEIEGGISSSTMKDGSTGSHIFSAFLTWMQEKSTEVFVAATANRIDLLPAEIIRKGRFDQIFFVDLPNDTERECIFRVHLSRRGYDPSGFDLPLLSVATELWNGAEIEHVVEAALVEAFNRNEKMLQDDLYTIIRSTVPLSRTMSEQIKYIKGWAGERAVAASLKDD